jgi:hypothetical protein
MNVWIEPWYHPLPSDIEAALAELECGESFATMEKAYFLVRSHSRRQWPEFVLYMIVVLATTYALAEMLRQSGLLPPYGPAMVAAALGYPLARGVQLISPARMRDINRVGSALDRWRREADIFAIRNGR